MSATAQLALDVRGFLAGMDLAKQGLNSLRNESGKVDEGNGMARLQVAAVGLAATVVALGVAMYKGVASTIELGARLVDVSYKSGLAVEEIMALERSLDEVGGKAEEAAPATDRFNQAIQQAANNAGPLVSVLKDAGISMESLAKMSVAERMTAVGDAIRAIANPAQQAEAAVAAFGASGVKMLAALDSKNLNSATAAMGSQAQIMQANAGVFARIMQLMGAQGSSLNSLAVAVKGKLQGLFTGIASGVAPTVLKIMEASAAGGMSLAASIRAFSPALEPLATLVESLVNMDLAGVGAQLGAGAAAIGEAIMNGDAIEFIKAGLVVAGAEFRGALLNAAEAIADAFSKLQEFMNIPALMDQLKAGMQSAGSALLGVLQQGMAFVLGQLRESSKVLKFAISENTVTGLAERGAAAVMSAANAIGDAVASVPAAFLEGTQAAQEASQGDIATAKATMAEITARATTSAGVTAEAMRAQFATPAAGEQAITMKAAAAEAPVGMIVSSLAKIGGDQGGSQQTGMLDIARSQLIAQQETAKNTAKIAEKMKSTSGSSDNAGSIYQ
jgi:hypothetical protein